MVLSRRAPVDEYPCLSLCIVVRLIYLQIVDSHSKIQSFSADGSLLQLEEASVQGGMWWGLSCWSVQLGMVSYP